MIVVDVSRFCSILNYRELKQHVTGPSYRHGHTLDVLTSSSIIVGRRLCVILVGVNKKVNRLAKICYTVQHSYSQANRKYRVIDMSEFNGDLLSSRVSNEPGGSVDGW